MNAKGKNGEKHPVTLSKGNLISIVALTALILGGVWTSWGSVTAKQAVFGEKFNTIEKNLDHTQEHIDEMKSDIDKNEAKAQVRYNDLRDLIIKRTNGGN